MRGFAGGTMTRNRGEGIDRDHSVRVDSQGSGHDYRKTDMPISTAACSQEQPEKNHAW